MGPKWRSTLDPLDDYVPALASGVEAKPYGLATLGLDPTCRPEMLGSKRSNSPPKWTSFSPPPTSLDPVDVEELVSAAYASHLDSLVAASHARLWIHGHLHRPADYWIGDTRIISNPRGYPDEVIDKTFNPALVIDLLS